MISIVFHLIIYFLTKKLKVASIIIIVYYWACIIGSLIYNYPYILYIFCSDTLDNLHQNQILDIGKFGARDRMLLILSILDKFFEKGRTIGILMPSTHQEREK